MDSPRKVYFIEAVGLDLIKIGFAANVTARLAELQTGSPVTLKLLGTMPGDKDIERFFHDQFAGQRVRGEWFRRSSELEKYIATCNPPAVPDEDEQRFTRREKRYAAYRMRKRNYNGALQGVPRKTRPQEPSP